MASARTISHLGRTELDTAEMGKLGDKWFHETDPDWDNTIVSYKIDVAYAYKRKWGAGK